MKTLIFTFCLMFFPCLATFNACSDAYNNRNGGNEPMPENDTKIIVPNNEERDDFGGMKHMPKFMPRFDFNN